MKTAAHHAEEVREFVTAVVNCSGANYSAAGLHDGFHVYVCTTKGGITRPAAVEATTAHSTCYYIVQNVEYIVYFQLIIKVG